MHFYQLSSTTSFEYGYVNFSLQNWIGALRLCIDRFTAITHLCEIGCFLPVSIANFTESIHDTGRETRQCHSNQGQSDRSVLWILNSQSRVPPHSSQEQFREGPHDEPGVHVVLQELDVGSPTDDGVEVPSLGGLVEAHVTAHEHPLLGGRRADLVQAVVKHIGEHLALLRVI